MRRHGVPSFADSEFGWWARQDSNLRPTGYEPVALPLSYRPTRFPDYTTKRPPYTSIRVCAVPWQGSPKTQRQQSL